MTVVIALLETTVLRDPLSQSNAPLAISAQSVPQPRLRVMVDSIVMKRQISSRSRVQLIITVNEGQHLRSFVIYQRNLYAAIKQNGLCTVDPVSSS